MQYGYVIVKSYVVPIQYKEKYSWLVRLLVIIISWLMSKFGVSLFTGLATGLTFLSLKSILCFVIRLTFL